MKALEKWLLKHALDPKAVKQGMQRQKAVKSVREQLPNIKNPYKTPDAEGSWKTVFLGDDYVVKYPSGVPSDMDYRRMAFKDETFLTNLAAKEGLALPTHLVDTGKNIYQVQPKGTPLDKWLSQNRPNFNDRMHTQNEIISNLDDMLDLRLGAKYKDLRSPNIVKVGDEYKMSDFDPKYTTFFDEIDPHADFDEVMGFGRTYEDWLGDQPNRSAMRKYLQKYMIRKKP